MSELAPGGLADGELTPATQQAISDTVQVSVNTAMLRFAEHIATKADVQAAVHDLLVSMGGLAAQIEAVRKPVLEGYPGTAAHISAVPANTDYRLRQMAQETAPQTTREERLWDKIEKAGFKRSIQVAIVLVFTVWGMFLDGCNETLRTTKHVATEIRIAYVGMLASAAQDAAEEAEKEGILPDSTAESPNETTIPDAPAGELDDPPQDTLTP